MSYQNLKMGKLLDLSQWFFSFWGIVISIATFVGFMGNWWWFFELLDHPRPQYCLILVFAIIIGGISQQPKSFLFCIPLFLNMAIMLPLFVPPNRDFFAENNQTNIGSNLQLIHINLDIHNPDFNRTVEYLNSQPADIVFLQEVTSESLDFFETNLPEYQVVISQPKKYTHGVAMLVPKISSPSVKIVKMEIIHLPSYSTRPLILATITWSDRQVEILSLHVTRPRTSRFQQLEFSAAAIWSQKILEKDDQEVIIIGDFNSTPWSGRFRQFMNESKLNNSQWGRGLQPTWNAQWPGLLRIPIDHCLHSQLITTLNRQPGTNIGSDHLPLFVEFGLKSQQTSPEKR